MAATHSEGCTTATTTTTTPRNIFQCESPFETLGNDYQNNHLIEDENRLKIPDNKSPSNEVKSDNKSFMYELAEKGSNPDKNDATNKIPVLDEHKNNSVTKTRNDKNGATSGGTRATSNNISNNNNVNNNNNNNNNGKNIGNTNKFQFRAPQQFPQKKWKKQFKTRQQRQLSINKADMENIQNIKNQLNHHRKQQQQQHSQKNVKQLYNRKLLQRSSQFSSLRSKFFLPDKRPRKEIIIPPTKFLLGGNISDPLNLNSLQDEALNPTPTVTPKQSPITTPPKVEVIIPPNIYDPLHLLDPVDSIEYEKQLVSPMKRKSKSKHRHRKKRRKRNENSISSDIVSTPSSVTNLPPFSNQPSTMTTPTVAAAATTSSINDSITNVDDIQVKEISVSTVGADKNGETREQNIEEKSSDSTTKIISDDNNSTDGVNNQKGNQKDCAQKVHSAGTNMTLVGRRTGDREKAVRDLHLDLGPAIEYQQQQQQQHQQQQQQNQQHSAGIGGGRKRKISEGHNSIKSKFRRLDSMDKIVSPVVPQPGAWKRPPRTVPTGARKNSRVRSTSVSENELISPTDDTKTIESESVRGDTPDVEAQKQDECTTENHPPIFPEQPKPKFRKEGAKYQYGNYNRYPGYRYLDEDMDVRIQVFKQHPDLFRGKDIQDIGCNVGHITIAVAKDLSPKSILGIDIDCNLIKRARRNLSMYVRIPKDNEMEESKESKKGEEKTEAGSSTSNVNHGKSETNANKSKKGQNATNKDSRPQLKIKRKKLSNSRRKGYQKSKIETEKHDFFPMSFPINYGGIPSPSKDNYNKTDTSPSTSSAAEKQDRVKNNFPKNVFFRAANYVLPDESLLNNDTQQYDLILCLSVTKWIHLNFGDTGLKQAFKRMFNQLRPGGKLILEAQNWASYKKKKNLTETIYNNYKSIEFFPNKFHEYLLSNEVGFSHSYTLGVPRHLSKGFCRPIQLYAKGDFTPNHVRWSDAYYPQTPYEAYRGIYASVPRPPFPLWGDTPYGNSGSYSCRQTPMHQPTSQYYNPLETDTYLPSYDTEVLNRHYVFASPLYQTVWSPPANLRNSSSHTPVFGSVRECDLEDGVYTSRHVYPPNEDCTSPQVSNGAFNSIREADTEDIQDMPQRRHVYAAICDSSSSPKAESIGNSPDVLRNNDEHTENGTYLDTGPENEESTADGGTQFESES